MERLVALIVLITLVTAKRRLIEGREPIECDGFKTQQCLDLVQEYYGINAEQLSEYGAMQQAVLADSIECHYIYDICPFYIPPITGQKIDCIDNKIKFTEDEETGEENSYECKDVNLFSFIPLSLLGSNNNASGADIWGYQTLDILNRVNHHYAITSQSDGATIVDITDPINPNVLAFIVSNVNGDLRNVLWRDVKVYRDWAIVVADTGGVDDHGIQIFNLREIIRDAEQFQAEFENKAPIYNVPKENIIIYDDVGRCHNVYVDNDIGHLYAFGSMGKNDRAGECFTGIHIIDINDPTNPTFMGCYDTANYVHDAQCVIYHGPDVRYTGHEICFMFTPDIGDLTIVDITDPNFVRLLSRTPYFTESYNHQGWVTSNHEYLLLDDETDEGPLPERFPVTQETTTTYIFDIRDLENIDYRRAHHALYRRAVDHNQYIVDNGHIYSSNHPNFRGYTFQANYEAGLRILNIDNIANENGNLLEEIAYFDLYPWKFHENGEPVYDNIKFFGAWSVYPYFNELGTRPNDNIYSNKLVVQSTTTGLYVVEFIGDMNFNSDARIGHDVMPNDKDEGGVFGGTVNAITYAVVVMIVVVGVLIVFVACKYYAQKRNMKKRSTVYERIVAMEDTNTKKYGTEESQRL